MDAPRSSRLPRPKRRDNPSVAELVKKYQDFLPAQGIHDLAQTAFPPKPLMSESEQEYPSLMLARPGQRSKSRHRVPVRKMSTSDFEQGYAANVAPRYLTHARRFANPASSSRIPAPKGTTYESQDSSRRASPDKRVFSGQGKDVRFSRPSSPHARQSTFGGTIKQPKNRVVSRTKDKAVARPATNTISKSTFRRPPNGTGTKVSNIAKHFERLGRDAERSKSKYTVIRGRRARPVASARAKVEILESVKDAICDDSESSDSSSEADDEDEGNEEDTSIASPQQRRIQESDATTISAEPEPNLTPSLEPLSSTMNNLPVESPSTALDEVATKPLQPLGQLTAPSSPFLSSIRNKQEMALTPPISDFELGGNGTERNSILRALSGFWPQAARNSIENDDPMSDPEHIFRDSSMVVRLDEPTSIIALALKWVF